MTGSEKQPFNWKELVDIFGIRDGECEEEQRVTLMERVNSLADKFGREYVIKKIALRQQH